MSVPASEIRVNDVLARRQIYIWLRRVGRDRVKVEENVKPKQHRRENITHILIRIVVIQVTIFTC